MQIKYLFLDRPIRKADAAHGDAVNRRSLFGGDRARSARRRAAAAQYPGLRIW
jgi:hypothetical protein